MVKSTTGKKGKEKTPVQKVTPKVQAIINPSPVKSVPLKLTQHAETKFEPIQNKIQI